MNNIFLIFCIIFAFGINGCKNNKKSSNETISIIEFSDVSMRIQDILPGGLSFTFENTSNKEYIYGSDYKLYALKNNVWESVEKIENTPSTAEAYDILP